MKPTRLTGTQAFIIASILAVVFLVPSAGLSTLTIPDDAYSGTSSTLQDLPHLGKRGADGIPLVALGITLVGIAFLFEIAYFVRAIAAGSAGIGRTYRLIRAPPAMLGAY